MDDAKTLFDSGALTKTYARDGQRFELSFGVEGNGDACTLKLFKLQTSKLGHTNTAYLLLRRGR